MKKLDKSIQPNDLQWDDLVKNCLQFASQRDGATTDSRGHTIRFSSSARVADHIFDVALKSK